jgi:hypothetical protein
MVKHLFPNFLDDPDEYRKSEESWQRLWTLQIDPFNRHHDWKPWINARFADGTAVMDGNPIFSRVSLQGRRGIRVIQDDPRGHDFAVVFWLDRARAGADGSVEIDELVIRCELSVEAQQYVSRMISDWVNKGEVTRRSDFVKTAYSDAGIEPLEPVGDHQLAA